MKKYIIAFIVFLYGSSVEAQSDLHNCESGYSIGDKFGICNKCHVRDGKILIGRITNEIPFPTGRQIEWKLIGNELTILYVNDDVQNPITWVWNGRTLNLKREPNNSL